MYGPGHTAPNEAWVMWQSNTTVVVAGWLVFLPAREGTKETQIFHGRHNIKKVFSTI
jgi:hypothetical protein